MPKVLPCHNGIVGPVGLDGYLAADRPIARLLGEQAEKRHHYNFRYQTIEECKLLAAMAWAVLKPQSKLVS